MKLPEQLLEMMWDADDDELPDGAWQAVIEDAVHLYNKMHKKRYNSFDSWLYYIQSDWRTKKIDKLLGR